MPPNKQRGIAMRLVLCSTLIISGLAGAAMAQQKAPAAIPVGTVAAERKAVSETYDFVGRVEAVNRVQINARVKGFLEAVLFKEGDFVKEGDPLYHIERGLFEASVEQAQGALERSKAAKALTAIQLERAEDLMKRQAGTVVARDQAKAADDQAAGAILTDEANLQTAKINLGYTEIASPIAGKVGRTNITKGNVVSPESGSLTLIVSQDPMYITFPVSQRDFLQAQKSRRTGDIKDVRIQFSDGSMYDQMGTVNFVDVTVDRATDTVLVRANMPNPKGDLIDGQFVQVKLASGAAEEKVIVPQAALIADQEGVYLFAVEDGKAVVKRVKPGVAVGGDVTIESGLSGGEPVIVQGVQDVRPGVAVRAVPMPPPAGRS
jgi:membrane fusion protein, multidrug efflux system